MSDETSTSMKTIPMYSLRRYAEIISTFDMTVIARLRPTDFENFGIKNSKVYCAEFLRVLQVAGLNDVQASMVVTLATAVKSKDRILNAMVYFEKEPWYQKVRTFFGQYCVQYTKEVRPGADTFAVVHIPYSVPFIASRCWLHMTESPTVEKFLQNLWAPQINLTKDLIDIQKKWERTFWDEMVKKGGPDFEKNGFNLNYWLTKAGDTYVLLKKNGFPFGTWAQKRGEKPYSREDIERWFSTKNGSDDVEEDDDDTFFDGLEEDKPAEPEDPDDFIAKMKELRKMKSDLRKGNIGERYDAEEIKKKAEELTRSIQDIMGVSRPSREEQDEGDFIPDLAEFFKTPVGKMSLEEREKKGLTGDAWIEHLVAVDYGLVKTLKKLWRDQKKQEEIVDDMKEKFREGEDGITKEDIAEAQKTLFLNEEQQEEFVRTRRALARAIIIPEAHEEFLTDTADSDSSESTY